MKVNTRRVGVAALALVVCLSISPVAAAVQPNDSLVNLREKVSRIFKKLKTLGGVIAFSDGLQPPKP